MAGMAAPPDPELDAILAGLPRHRRELFEARLERWLPDLTAALRPLYADAPAVADRLVGARRGVLRRARRGAAPARPAPLARARLVPAAVDDRLRRLRRPLRAATCAGWPSGSATSRSSASATCT